MIRDWWTCTVVSVMFEFLEYSLEHQLPNFSECWWDHVGAAPRGAGHTAASCRLPGAQGPLGPGETERSPQAPSSHSGSWTCSSATGWASTAA